MFECDPRLLLAGPADETSDSFSSSNLGFSPVGSIFGPNFPGAALAAMGVGTKPLFQTSPRSQASSPRSRTPSTTRERIRNLPIILDKLL
jgi:hypothetical protein